MSGIKSRKNACFWGAYRIRHVRAKQLENVSVHNVCVLITPDPSAREIWNLRENTSLKGLKQNLNVCNSEVTGFASTHVAVSN